MSVAVRLHEQLRTGEAVQCLECPELARVEWPDRVPALLGLAEVRAASGDFAGARAVLLVHADRSVDAEDHAGQRAQAVVENALGVVCRTLGKVDEAELHYTSALARLRALEPGDELASLLHNLAGLCHARAASAAGVEHGRAGLALRIRLHGADHELVAADRANLAGLLYDTGCVDEAEEQFHAAIGTFTKALGDDHPEVAVCLSGLASISAERGDRRRAERLYRRAIGIKEAHWGTGHVDTLVTEYNLARLLADDGRRAEALAIADRVVALLGATVDEGHRVLVRARDLLSELDTPRTVEPTTHPL